MNETIDRLLNDDDETLFIVQGSNGRVPILATNEQEARERYAQMKPKEYSTLIKDKD